MVTGIESFKEWFKGKQVRKGRVTIEEAAEDAGMTVEEFKKVMENTSLQAV